MGYFYRTSFDNLSEAKKELSKAQESFNCLIGSFYREAIAKDIEDIHKQINRLEKNFRVNRKYK